MVAGEVGESDFYMFVYVFFSRNICSIWFLSVFF